MATGFTGCNGIKNDLGILEKKEFQWEDLEAEVMAARGASNW